jgi:EAL and modified HD-GYP domain-containing signal transduction protein
MEPQDKEAPISELALPPLPGELRYMVRQPIMDMHGRVHAYELLFRSGPGGFIHDEDGLASRIMLDNTVLFGLEKLAGGLPAFVNCSSEALLEGIVDVLPTSMTVLEILQTVKPTPKLIEACRTLKASGFRIALDDFVWMPEFAPLVDLADYIKVDFIKSDEKARKLLRKQLSGTRAALVAEEVGTREDYKDACDEGFRLFQGYYFCRPVLLKNRKVPSNRLSQIGILELLRGDTLNLHKLSQHVKLDTSLTYRLLRLVNSPLYGVRQEVRSIETALVVVGEDAFRRIAMLAITCELNADQPMEVLRMAFVRGRFCELAARLCSLNPTEQYLLGMLSLLPVMLHLPMEALVQELPLRDQVREALQGWANTDGILLRWVENHERGAWAACDAEAQAFGLRQVDLAGYYAEAVMWAEAALGVAH